MIKKIDFFYLKKKLNKDTFQLILKISKIADEYGIKIYLVGGLVRDLFLNKKDADIDLTVEGDGTKFAKFLAQKFDLPFKCFEKFKTGKIYLKNKIIDISSARVEKYEKPAQLPDIDFSNIKQDLFRRDFTINSMAIQINQKKFGIFLDFFNGFNDLKKGIIRVLHEKSFIDDPTRILRAIRFACRFNFKIEKKTRILLKKALKKNIFNYVSGERIRNEILLILKEKKTYEILKKAENFGILKLLNKKLRIINFTKDYYNKTDDFIIRFLFFIYNLNKNQSLSLTEKLKLDNNTKKIVNSVKTIEKKVMSLFKTKKLNKKLLYDLFKKANEKVINYFIILCKDKKIKDYILKIKNTKINLTGKDLIKHGIKEGIEIGKILDKIRYEKINNKIKTKYDEIKFLKRRL